MRPRAFFLLPTRGRRPDGGGEDHGGRVALPWEQPRGAANGSGGASPEALGPQPGLLGGLNLGCVPVRRCGGAERR